MCGSNTGRLGWLVFEYFWRPKSENKCDCHNKEQVAEIEYKSSHTYTHAYSQTFAGFPSAELI